jgi:outer membrane protein
MKIRLYAILGLFLLGGWALPLMAQGQDEIREGDTLTLERCLRLALAKHPSILAATNTIRVNESRIGQAQSDYYPQVNLQNLYSRTSPYSSSPRVTITEQYNSYSSSVGLSQNIYDFERRPNKVKIAQLNTESTRLDLDNTVSLVILGVKQSYYGLIQAEKNQQVSKETVQQFEHHLIQAKAFFEVGTKPKFDVTKAEVDLGNAKLNLIRTENAVRIARINLNNAMGIPHAPSYTLSGDLLFHQNESIFAEALKKAYETRPDLRSLLLRQESASQAVALAKAAHYPTLTGNANYGYGGTEYPLDNGWSVGGTLNIPIFSGFLVQKQVDEARANLDVVKANVEALKQQIRLEVEQASSNVREAFDRIGTTQLIVRQAEENVALANGRYNTGVGNPIEVTDALVALSNAKTAYISALTDYKTAQASLEKAMGVR